MSGRADRPRISEHVFEVCLQEQIDHVFGFLLCQCLIFILYERLPCVGMCGHVRAGFQACQVEQIDHVFLSMFLKYVCKSRLTT